MAGSQFESELNDLLRRRDLRSADRANMERMRKLLHDGQQLSYQDRANLWAYVERYRRPGIVVRD